MVALRMCNRQEDLRRILGPHFTLTRHFVQNWRERVGNECHVDVVRVIVESSVVLQRGRRLVNSQGHQVNTLSMFWHPEMKMVITVDRHQNTAVSVLTDHEAPRPRGGFKKLMKAIANNGYSGRTRFLLKRHRVRANGGRR